MKTRLVLMRKIPDSRTTDVPLSAGHDGRHTMVKFQGLFLLCVGLLFPMISLASEEGQGHRHHVAVFVGATHAEGTDEPTVGADYEYRLTPKIGLGVLVDHAGGDLDATIVAGALFFHLHDGWRLLAAAGNENTDHGDEFITRIGVGYDFELGGSWALTPQLNFDFVEDEETKEVYGVSIGKAF